MVKMTAKKVPNKSCDFYFDKTNTMAFYFSPKR